MKTSRLAISLGCILASLLSLSSAFAQAPDPAIYEQRQKAFSAQMEARGLSDAFKGITSDGSILEGLYPIKATGVSTSAMQSAAESFLQTLSAEQKAQTLFAIDDDEWRKWGNQHIYYRQGISFQDMNAAQHQAALKLLNTTLSPKGFTLARNIMRLNETLGELNNNNFVEYGESKYWLSFMGEPSGTEPWGWQLDGHHLILNFFMLGDQVVMTPAFWGSEPAVANAGKYAGTRIMDAEQDKALTLIRALDNTQQALAIIASPKTGNNILTQAFSDNVIVPEAGIAVSRFTPEQKALLIDLIALYTSNLAGAHAQVALEDITRHLDDTWFAWVGETGDDSVFYYRIQSPVILIEFDHETPVGLTHLYPRGVPYKEHIHAVVRTPNGNDYGKDLLRQHYQNFEH